MVITDMSNFALMLPFDPFAEVQEGIFEFSRNAARGIYFLKRHHPGFEQIDKERVAGGMRFVITCSRVVRLSRMPVLR